jgi:short/branched chain acyl-CoA dehydrogenase
LSVSKVIQECFSQGLMGIETPSELGGAGMTFFSSVLVIEELARVDPSVSVMVDVQNTLANVGILKVARFLLLLLLLVFFFKCFFLSTVGDKGAKGALASSSGKGTSLLRVFFDRDFGEQDTVASFCLSEWGSGSDAFALKTRATPIAGGGWELNGSKGLKERKKQS